MMKCGHVLAGSVLLVLGLGLSCAGDDDDNDNDNDNTHQSGSGGIFGNSGGTGNQSGGGEGATPRVLPGTDVDNNGALTYDDVVASGAAILVTEQDVEAFEQSACSAWQVEPEPLGATLFLVLDASSSMRDTAAGTGALSKWEVTRDALVAAISQLPDATYMGFLAYPNMTVTQTAGPTTNCVNVDAMVPLQSLGQNREAVVSTLRAVETQTCTPTHDAYLTAVTDFASAEVPGTKYVLLMTDGQPTYNLGCSPSGQCGASAAGPDAEQAVIAEIQNAASIGIKTFILGSPGSEMHTETGLDNRWWLSQAAEVGGTSIGNCSHSAEPYCHFDMTTQSDFATALNQALSRVFGEIVRCDYAVQHPDDPDQQVNLDQINLFIRAQGAQPLQLFRQQSSSCAHGWYLDEAAREVKLCPGTCEIVKYDARAELELYFGCDSTYVPR